MDRLTPRGHHGPSRAGQTVVTVRDVVVRTATNPSAPADAVDAVSASIISVTRELAASGRWPGITPKEPAA